VHPTWCDVQGTATRRLSGPARRPPLSSSVRPSAAP